MVMSYPQFLNALAQATGKKEYADYAAFLVENYSTCAGSRQPHLQRLQAGEPAGWEASLFRPRLQHDGQSLAAVARLLRDGRPAIQAGRRKCPRQVRPPDERERIAAGRRRQPRPRTIAGDSHRVLHDELPCRERLDCRREDGRQAATSTSPSGRFSTPGMGARLPDGTAHAYLKRDSEFSLEYPGIFHREQYSPAHEPFCCTTRMMSMMPAYVGQMFKKTADGKALAALCYGPATVKTDMAGVKVRVEEKTLYPFEGRIEFRVQAEKPVTFEFMVRVPTWSPAAEVQCAGATVGRQGEYCVVTETVGRGGRGTRDF